MSRKTSLIRIVSILIVAAVVAIECHGHGHSHGGHHHGHSHDDHDHGHAHGGHHHGHVHSHGGHDDHHHHHQEPNPAFKYSKQANEKPAQQKNDHGHQHSHEDHHHSHEKVKRAAEPPKQAAKQQRDKTTIILHAVGSTLLISIVPFVLLFFIPLNNSKENEGLLKILLAFTSGSLLGDAFLHLIPHALNPHDHHGDEDEHSHSSHAHDHSAQANVGLWILFGIMAFLLVEKMVRALKGDSHSHSHSSHAHTHSHEGKAKKSDDEDEKSDSGKQQKKKSGGDEKKPKKADKKIEESKEIQVSGYLNLAADFSHNFTDGLAIGASFLAGQNIGFITTLTILFHEVPHEIGDFAVLIQSGCSKKKAIFLQLLTAVGALAGTLVSLLFESAITGFATSCILPFTAGGFIYIATVSIIPELKENSGFLRSLGEILALVVGVAFMAIIAYIE